MNRSQTIGSILYGWGIGGVISILPFPLNFLLIVVAVGFAGVSLLRSPVASNWRRRALEAGAATAVIATAIALPVKQLDGQVGPMRYEAMPLGQLTRRLFEDWRVMVSSDSLASSERVVAFSTLAPMSRRQVLQNLARETGAELRIGYCGTGATFLFGAHPSFTRLRFAPLIGLTNAGAVRDRP